MQASNRKQQGFTLVEVIVVAVIVAALAAVSVPLYLNYVNSSRINAASNTAGSVASFVGSCQNASGILYNGATGTTVLATGVVTGGTTIRCDVPGNLPNEPTIGIPVDINVTFEAQRVNGRHTSSATTEVSPWYSFPLALGAGS